MQRTLFDAAAPQAHRNTDPISSADGERAATESGSRYTDAQEVLDAVRAYPGMTYRELTEKIGRMESAAVMRRLNDLRRLNLVCPGEKRACRITNIRVTTWSPR